MERLSTATLAQRESAVLCSDYRREGRNVGIVHLGVGAFHRAHQSYYTDKALAQFGGDWLTVGISLRGEEVQQQLAPQNYLYTLLEQKGGIQRATVIASISNVLFLGRQREEVDRLMVSESVRIVSLTITEKGYCRLPATGALDLHNPEIQYDLHHPNEPVTAIGLIVKSLKQRFKRQLSPITLLSCDNLPCNGMALQRVVMEFAQQIDSDLAQWIKREIAFPNSMVDRIVPAVTDTTKDLVAAKLGLRDEGCVSTESFSQWVIEDKFVNGRPHWDKVGVTFTEDVEAFEAAKLRLLNGAHSAMAYIGYLSAMNTVDDCMSNAIIRNFVHKLMMEEIAAVVVAPRELDLQQYIESLMDRFTNSALQHQCYQIAMDGSQKIPPRLLSTITDALNANKSIDRCCLAVAAWMIYITSIDVRGNQIIVQDPLAQDLHYIAAPHRYDAKKLVDVLLQERRIFSLELASHSLFKQVLTGALEQILNKGILGALSNV